MCVCVMMSNHSFVTTFRNASGRCNGDCLVDDISIILNSIYICVYYVYKLLPLILLCIYIDGYTYFISLYLSACLIGSDVRSRVFEISIS